jgi:MoxR-like ATPase
VLTQDVIDLVADVFRHRLVLSYQALADAVTPDQIIQKVMQHIPAPEKPLETHVHPSARS